MVVVDGFKSEIRQRTTGFMGSVVLCAPGQSPLNQSAPFSENLSYRGALDSISGCTSVSGVAYRSGMVKGGDDFAGICFKGVDSLYDFSFFRDVLVEGSLPEFGGRIGYDILISKTVASRLGLKVSDKVKAYFAGGSLKMRSFRVCGIFEAALEDIDKNFALVDIRHIRRLNGWTEGEVSSIELRFDEGTDPDRAADAVEEVEYRNSGEGDRPLFAFSIKRIYANLFDWLAVLDLNVVMILTLMILVAGFNMISALLIILFGKMKMIGLLKAMGMTDRRVSGVFLRLAARVVGKGMLWGNVLSIGICLIEKWTHFFKLDPANYFVSYVPVRFDLANIAILEAVAAAAIMLILCSSSVFIAKISPATTLKAS